MAIFTNQATLSYNGGVANSNIAYGEILDVLAATKTAIEGTYTPGSVVTYAVTLRNTGGTALNGLTVTDDLGGYAFGGGTVYPLTYVEGSATLLVDGVPTAVTVTDTEPLTLSGFTLPAGGSAVVVYNADVTAFAPPAPDGQIINTVTVNGIGAAVTATETVNAENGAVLTVIKEVEPDTVGADGLITYTITVQNLGNTEAGAEENAVISDVFDPILTITEVTLNGQPLVEGVDYTYNETTGEFVTIPGQITVPAATFTQDPVTGVWTTSPGVSVLTVTGTV